MIIVKMLVKFFSSHRFLAALLTSIAIAGTLMVYIENDEVSTHPISNNTYSPKNYQFGLTNPVSLGRVNETNNSYIKLKLNFNAYNLVEHQNVFQTSSGNKGLRLEISGSIASLLVSDKLVEEEVKGLILSSGINANQWYELQLIAKNGESILVTLNGKKVLDYKSQGINLKADDILIGQGYDVTRKFKGHIKNIIFEEGVYTKKMISNKFNELKYLIYAFSIFVLCYFTFSLFELSISNKLFNEFISISLTLLVIIFYNILFYNKYFPITEGWFSTYSLIMQNGGVPYRDFYLFLTPLYPFQISAFQSVFGNSLYFLRVLGLIVSIFSTLFLYLILRNFFIPLIACVSTVTAIIYYESGVAFINYDFTQFLTLYCLCSIYFLISISNNYNSKYIIFKSFLAGLFASLAFLIKQSNGGLYLVFSSFSFLFLLFNMRKYKLFLPFAFGVVLPVISVVSYLHTKIALQYFYEQVFIGAIQSKGISLSDIMFGWMKRFEFDNLFRTIIYIKKIIFILPMIYFINYFLLLKFKKNTMNNKNLNHYIFIYTYYSILIIYIAINRGALYDFIMAHNKFNIFISHIPNISLIGFIALTLYLLYLHLFKSPLNSIKTSSLTVIFLTTLGLILGNGTSAGIGEISLFLPFAFLIGSLMSLIDPTRLQRLVICFSCVMIIFSYADSKFKVPYAWWFISEPEIYDNSHEPKISLLEGMQLSANSAINLYEISKAISSNSTKNEDVFIFPNISGLYTISDRLPHSKSVVTWFDFLPDHLASKEANRILENPPKIIANLVLPKVVWDAHENYFRGGMRMGQRDIQEAIENMTIGRYSKFNLVYTKQISPEAKIEIWSRK